MSANWYHAALVLHIMGITLMAGSTFIDYVSFKAFSKAYPTDNARAVVLEEFLFRLQRFMGIGLLLILVSGITMMAKLHEVWGAQLWFRIKMVLLLLVIANGLGIRRMLGNRLHKLLLAEPSQSNITENWRRLHQSFNTVQLLQLLFFVLIFILSVFKFN